MEPKNKRKGSEKTPEAENKELQRKNKELQRQIDELQLQKTEALTRIDDLQEAYDKRSDQVTYAEKRITEFMERNANLSTAHNIDLAKVAERDRTIKDLKEKVESLRGWLYDRNSTIGEQSKLITALRAEEKSHNEDIDHWIIRNKALHQELKRLYSRIKWYERLPLVKLLARWFYRPKETEANPPQPTA